MKILIFLLVGVSIGFSQFFTEDFSNFVRTDTTNVSVFYVFDTTWQNEVGGATIVDDFSGKNRDLSIVGWSNLAQVEDSLAGSSLLYSGGEGLKFNNSSYYLNRTNSVGLPSGASQNWSIVIWGKILSLPANWRIMTHWGANVVGQQPHLGIANGPDRYAITTGGNDVYGTVTPC